MVKISNEPGANDIYNRYIDTTKLNIKELSLEGIFDDIYRSFKRDYLTCIADYLDAMEEKDISKFSSCSLLMSEAMYLHDIKLDIPDYEFDNVRRFDPKNGSRANSFIRSFIYLRKDLTKSNHGYKKAGIIISKNYNKIDNSLNTFLTTICDGEKMNNPNEQKLFTFIFMQRYIDYILIKKFGFSYSKEGLITIKDTIDAPYFVYLYLRTYAMMYIHVFGYSDSDIATCTELLHYTNYGPLFVPEYYDIFSCNIDSFMNYLYSRLSFLNETYDTSDIYKLSDINYTYHPFRSFRCAELRKSQDNITSHDIILNTYKDLVLIAKNYILDSEYMESINEIFKITDVLYDLNTMVLLSQ